LERIHARILFDFVMELNDFWKSGYGKGAINLGPLDGDAAQIISKISNLTRDIRTEIIRTKFKKADHTDLLLRRLRDIEASFLKTVLSRANPNNNKVLFDTVSIAALEGITELIENSESDLIIKTSRSVMVLETEKLINEIKEWEIEKYAKDALLMQLNYIIRTIQAADLYSDSEIRSQVKSVIADFACEFSSMDKKYQTKLERLVQWGRFGLLSGTTLIGLTADVTAITALLPPP